MTTPRPIFTKKLTKTDVGEKGVDGKKSNQDGVDVWKSAIGSFPDLDNSKLNPEVEINAIQTNGETHEFRFIHFNNKFFGGTRDVYRITGIGEYFRTHIVKRHDVLTLTPQDDGLYRLVLISGSSLVTIEAGEADEDDEDAPDDDPYKRVMQSIRQRRGQSKFRKKLLQMYDHRCVISGHGPDDVLEAAHIEPHSIAGHNSSENGLLLRADLHTLMDAGRIAINPENYRVMIHVNLLGTPYEQFMNTPIRKPKFGTGPNSTYLRERFESVFLAAPSEFLPLANTELFGS